MKTMFGSKEKETRPTTNLDTWIGPRITIEGKIHFSGGMRVDGVVRGTLIADDDKESVLTLSDKGSIEGELRAPHVEINGAFKGDIIASERIKLGSMARVTGNIYYKILEMAAGAEVSGQIVRQEDPRRQLARPEPTPAAPELELRAEARLEAKIEPKEKSKLEAKRA
jgi:cytoskeletal protein CcmA (bactofilin family)